jgi:hypothetical protein
MPPASILVIDDDAVNLKLVPVQRKRARSDTALGALVGLAVEIVPPVLFYSSIILWAWPRPIVACRTFPGLARSAAASRAGS